MPVLFTKIGVALMSTTTPSIIDTVKSSFEQASVDTVAMIGSIAPYAISIFVAMFIFKKGKKFFNTMG